MAKTPVWSGRGHQPKQHHRRGAHNTHGLTEFFDLVVSSLDVEHPKPHPESLFKILDFFQVGPERILYVGDSVVDEETARRAGVPFVAFGNEALKAYRHVRAMAEIRALLKDSVPP